MDSHTRMDYAPVAAVLLVVASLALSLRRRVTGEALSPMFKPTLYFLVDSETNARHWYDFGGRNSTDINRGYVQVALDAVRRTQGNNFTITPLVGRRAIIAEIPNADPQAVQLPPALFRMWAIANLCKYKGGLVMDGNSTICVAPFQLQGVRAAVFGVDPDEPVANPVTAVAEAPAPYVGYAESAHHPAWNIAARILNAVVSAGPTSWSAALARRVGKEVYGQQRTQGITVIREADGGRLASGKARQLEDIFGRVAVPAGPNTALLPGTVYVPFDGDDLIRRYEFAWFVRMSPQQIRDSELVWAAYAGLI